jgi:hypothetical protein
MRHKQRRFFYLLSQPGYRTKLLVFILIGIVIFLASFWVGSPFFQGILSNFLVTFLAVAFIQFLWDFLGGDPAESRFVNLQNGVDSVRHVLNMLTGEVIERHDAYQDSGLIAAHPNLPNDTVVAGISGAAQLVRILQTWMGNFITLEEAICEAVTKGCKVQILLLDPKSDQAKARSKDIKYTSSDAVSEAIGSNLGQLARVFQNVKQSPDLEVRLYDATPIMTLYWYDDICYMGLYWRNRSAIQGPQLQIYFTGKSYLGDIIKSHFEDLWKSSEPVDLSKIKLEPASVNG